MGCFFGNLHALVELKKYLRKKQNQKLPIYASNLKNMNSKIKIKKNILLLIKIVYKRIIKFGKNKIKK